MDLLGMLRKLGDRIGIIEMSSASGPVSAPAKIQTRTVTLTELVMNIHVTEIRELAEMPAELDVPFEDVFKAAGIPSDGWTVNRLQEFLGSERIRGMDRAEAQQETVRMLSGEKVDPADLVKDAMSRDRALDAFEDSIRKKREQWLAEKTAQIHRLQQEIAAEKEKWSQWRQRKRQLERNMAHAVGYLIDRPVISIDDEG
jgi:hypothetical protein